jgi:hypothetical protein
MSAARVAHEGTPYNEQGSFLLKMMLFRSDTMYEEKMDQITFYLEEIVLDALLAVLKNLSNISKNRW